MRASVELFFVLGLIALAGLILYLIQPAVVILAVFGGQAAVIWVCAAAYCRVISARAYRDRLILGIPENPESDRLMIDQPCSSDWRGI